MKRKNKVEKIVDPAIVFYSRELIPTDRSAVGKWEYFFNAYLHKSEEINPTWWTFSIGPNEFITDICIKPGYSKEQVIAWLYESFLYADLKFQLPYIEAKTFLSYTDSRKIAGRLLVGNSKAKLKTACADMFFHVIPSDSNDSWKTFETVRTYNTIFRKGRDIAYGESINHNGFCGDGYQITCLYTKQIKKALHFFEKLKTQKDEYTYCENKQEFFDYYKQNGVNIKFEKLEDLRLVS